MELKICSKCKEQKFISEFSKQKGRTDGLNGHCKQCRNLYLKHLRKGKSIEKKRKIDKQNCKDTTALVIPDYPNYTINPKGIIRNLKTGIELKGHMKCGYKMVTLMNKDGSRRLSVHKLLAKIFIPCNNNHDKNINDLVVDHYDRNRSNNSLENLKWVTISDNSLNRTKSINCSSKFIGVSWHKNSKKWRTQICINGKKHYIGTFDNELDAAKAYEKKKISLINTDSLSKTNFEDNEMTIPIKQKNDYSNGKYKYSVEMLSNINNRNKIIFDEFPDYYIYDNGVIKNNKTNRFVPGSINNQKYRVVNIVDKNKNKKHFLVHRLVALAFLLNPHNKPYVDHIDCNTLNNLITNLRWVTPKENTSNSRKRKNTVSKYKGVSWSKKIQKWIASITKNGKRIILGEFDNEDEAARTYSKKAKIEYGEFYRE